MTYSHQREWQGIHFELIFDIVMWYLNEHMSLSSIDIFLNQGDACYSATMEWDN